jgi:bifunctional UDP-N-acetylglucosamine pyrophosphorylase/glucosamine-1-phosphate N-acetyltransferase
MSDKIYAIILASLDESGMKSELPTVMHAVCGRSMLEYVLDAAVQAVNTTPVIAAAKEGDRIRQLLHGNPAEYRLIGSEGGQDNLKGLLQAIDYKEDPAGYTFIISGNLPLVQGSTLQDMLLYIKKNHLGAVEARGSFLAPPVACFQNKALFEAAQELHSKKAAGCYGVENTLQTVKALGMRTDVFPIQDVNEFFEVTNRIRLAEAEALMRRRINAFHMMNGVTIIDPSCTYISADVQIGKDSIIYPGNVLEGAATIGCGCILYPNNRLKDAVIGCRVTLQSSVVLDSRIGDDTTVGPYAYIRPGSEVGSHVRIGDFVEIKNSTIGEHTKISHLTYIGDAELGKGINVGCGVVSVNYDGKHKHKTIIGDHAFIGCNVNLVAPVEVEENAYIAAGSTITEKVPAKALAIARARQVNKEGWVDKREHKKTEEKQ